MLCPRCRQPIRHDLDKFDGYCQNCEDWTVENHPSWSQRRLGRSPYYDREGNAIPLSVWAMITENRMSQVVIQTFIMNDGRQVIFHEMSGDQARPEEAAVIVSTVWLGLDMGFGTGPPLIFETMIFGGPLDEYQERWSTEEKALRGHAEAVDLVTIALEAKRES